MRYRERLAGARHVPYWWDAAPRPEAYDTPPPADAEIAIVGSGYTGLSAALTLARAGRDVVVFDADAAGWGASSRNGGMVGPSFPKPGLAGLARRHGRERALAIMRESIESLTYLTGLIEREGIDCHFARVGRFRGAMSPGHHARMAREVETLAELGVPADLVPRERQHEEIGSDLYHGGIVLLNDGGLHPGLYHLGLLDRAREAGARIVSHCRVEAVEPERQRIALRTARGEVSAGHVVVATNGYTGPVTPHLRRRVVPIRTAIIATEPLPPETMDRLMPKRRMIGESRRLFHYFRPSPDGTRILFGGRTRHRADRPVENGAGLYEAMVEIFPELDGIGVTHSWSGLVAYTFDGTPHLGERDGVHYAMGWCGSGVGRSTFYGHKTALQLLGDPAGESALDGLPFGTRPGYTGRPWFLPPAIVWNRLMDRIGA